MQEKLTLKEQELIKIKEELSNQLNLKQTED